LHAFSSNHKCLFDAACVRLVFLKDLVNQLHKMPSLTFTCSISYVILSEVRGPGCCMWCGSITEKP